MKKLVSIIILFVCLFTLTSCFNGGVSKPKTGRKVAEITLTKTNNEKITIDKNTDPVLVYHLIKELYQDDYCFEYYGKYIKRHDERINKTYKGLFLLNDNQKYYSHKNKLMNLEHYHYRESLKPMGENYVYIDILKDKPLYGNARYNGKYYNFINDGEVVRTQYPANYDISDKKTQKRCDYISSGDTLNSIIMHEGLLGGLYIEQFADQFDYKVTLTKNYIIFSVKQSIGLELNMFYGEHYGKEGSFEKEIYFNISTYQIDYVKSNASIYNNTTYPGVLLKYNYVLSRVDYSKIQKDLDFLESYTKENVVERS